jgi:[ribosomal protein S18]-alanine N-acetyltransferase
VVNELRNDSLQVQEFVASEKQIGQLRQLCLDWRNSDQFWDFDQTLEFTAMNHSKIYFLEMSEKVVGAILILFSEHQTELCYIYVIESLRSKGVAEFFLNNILSKLEILGVSCMFLEVRVSNVAALGLYEKIGFTQVGVRAKYYSNGEDALVLRRTISED